MRGSARSKEYRIIDLIFPDKMRALIIIIILVIAFLITRLAIHWQYGAYDLNLSDSGENTLVYSYYSVGSNVLKCASDTAFLCDENNNTLWQVNYEMTNPVVEISGDTFIIYDKNGTAVGVYGVNGIIGEFNTDMPIITASVASMGTVAAILDDGNNTRIDYCDSSGEIISTIKTNIESDGYPMSISLSSNGSLLAVSYLGFESSRERAEIRFYNFSASGQRETDNVVSSYYYDNCIIPEVRYLNDTDCVAFGTDRIVVFDRADIPLEKKNIPVSDIQSTFHTDKYFGVITAGSESGMAWTIRVYDSKGKEQLIMPTDFTYIDVTMKETEIVFSGRNEMCVISLLGDVKYKGSPSNMMRRVVPLKNNKFAYITAESFNIITLS